MNRVDLKLIINGMYKGCILFCFSFNENEQTKLYAEAKMGLVFQVNKAYCFD